MVRIFKNPSFDSIKNFIYNLNTHRKNLGEKMSEISQEVKNELLLEIEKLEASLTGNMFEDMDTKGKIHNIQMKVDGVRPSDSSIECVGCGS